MDDAADRVVAKLEAFAADLPPDELVAFGLMLSAREDDEVAGFDMSSTSQQDQLNLQMLMSNRDQLETTFSNMLKSSAATAQSIIANIKS